MNQDSVKNAVSKRPKARQSAGPIDVNWQLSELPSSQHRAGLAGLVLMVEYLRRRPFEGMCEIVRCDHRGACLRVDARGMQSLFDDLYAATLEEVFVEKPWKNAVPKREESVDIARTTKKGLVVVKERRFVYDVVEPRCAFLAEIEKEAGANRKPWLKLFRDMLWGILRGVPATRGPFNQRAKGEVATDGMELFELLARNTEESVALPSTYFLGAQQLSADQIPFQDRQRFQMLLDFWPYAARVYVPAVENAEGKRDFVGFAIAVPDVADLEVFVKEWLRSLGERDGSLLGYLPRDAVIDVPAEAGLDLFAKVRGLIASNENQSRVSDLVFGVDVFHCEKEGNNVRNRGVTRVRADSVMAGEYVRVRGAYWSIPFRAQRIRNVLSRRPWWAGFGALLALSRHQRTFDEDYFRRDAREAFERIEGVEMTEQQSATIEALVYRTVGIYLGGRLASKYDLSWDACKSDEASKHEYQEKREKLAKEAFLAIRSRTATEFCDVLRQHSVFGAPTTRRGQLQAHRQ